MDHRLPTDTDDGMLLIISGPSGVGKTTITRAVERTIRGAVFSVSTTTREHTAVDVEGVDYHFVTREEFEELDAKGEFLETADVFGKMYGTPRTWVMTQLDRGRLVILEIDVRGAEQIKEKIPDAYAIFILPPSEEELLNRLRKRKREPEEKIQKRFAEAKREMAQARSNGIYDAFIVNEDLDKAIEEAIHLVREARQRIRE